MKELMTAFLAAQMEVKNAIKDSKNPHFKNDYASLEAVLDAVKPVLNKHGLVLIQSIQQAKDPGFVVVKTNIVHAATGEAVSDDLPVPLAKVDPQGLGSAITYGRRYGLQAMMGIASEDDDGEAQRVDKPTKPAQVVKFGGAADKKEESKPADPAKVAEVTSKLTSALGFKKS